MAYDRQAQDYAFALYAQGLSKDKALREMRKEYPGFAGSTWDEWVAKLNWRERRAALDLKSQEFDALCRDTARILMLELNEIRARLVTIIREGKMDTQTVYAYTSTAKQIADLARQQVASQDPAKVAMATLQLAIEKLLDGLRQIADLAKPLERNAPAIGKLVEEIAEEFGREAAR